MLDCVNENITLKKQNEQLMAENGKAKEILEEYEILKRKVFDLSLLLHARVERIIKEGEDGQKRTRK